jgi:hypothetical protein
MSRLVESKNSMSKENVYKKTCIEKVMGAGKKEGKKEEQKEMQKTCIQKVVGDIWEKKGDKYIDKIAGKPVDNVAGKLVDNVAGKFVVDNVAGKFVVDNVAGKVDNNIKDIIAGSIKHNTYMKKNIDREFNNSIITLNSGGVVNLSNNIMNNGNPQDPNIVSIIGFSNSSSTMFNSVIDLSTIGNLMSYLAPVNMILNKVMVQFQFSNSLNLGLDLGGKDLIGTLHLYIYINTNPKNNIFTLTPTTGSISIGNSVTEYQNFMMNIDTSIMLQAGDRMFVVVGNGLSDSNLITQFSGTVVGSLYFSGGI